MTDAERIDRVAAFMSFLDRLPDEEQRIALNELRAIYLKPVYVECPCGARHLRTSECEAPARVRGGLKVSLWENEK